MAKSKYIPHFLEKDLAALVSFPSRNTEFWANQNLSESLSVSTLNEFASFPWVSSFVHTKVGWAFCALFVRYGTSAVCTAVRVAWLLIRLTLCGANSHHVGVVG